MKGEEDREEMKVEAKESTNRPLISILISPLPLVAGLLAVEASKMAASHAGYAGVLLWMVCVMLTSLVITAMSLIVGATIVWQLFTLPRAAMRKWRLKLILALFVALFPLLYSLSGTVVFFKDLPL